jgi:hypothetical protein
MLVKKDKLVAKTKSIINKLNYEDKHKIRIMMRIVQNCKDIFA